MELIYFLAKFFSDADKFFVDGKNFVSMILSNLNF